MITSFSKILLTLFLELFKEKKHYRNTLFTFINIDFIIYIKKLNLPTVARDLSNSAKILLSCSMRAIILSISYEAEFRIWDETGDDDETVVPGEIIFVPKTIQFKKLFKILHFNQSNNLKKTMYENHLKHQN